MNENSNRALLFAGLSANVMLLMLTLLDYALNDSQYMWPLFVAWAFVILLLLILAVATWRTTFFARSYDPATPALARAVSALAARPEKSTAPALARAVSALATRPAAPAPAKSTVVELEPFPFVYNDYTLYTRKVALKNGGERAIWFFSKRKPASGEPAAKPSGFHVGVNERTGLPFLKKGTGKDGEDLTPHHEPGLQAQCAALTHDGAQCRNSSRIGSKYCASHFGYQPPTQKGIAKRVEGDSWSPRDKVSDKDTVKGTDTKPRVKRAPDTKVSVRKKAKAAKA